MNASFYMEKYLLGMFLWGTAGGRGRKWKFQICQGGEWRHESGLDSPDKVRKGEVVLMKGILLSALNFEELSGHG